MTIVIILLIIYFFGIILSFIVNLADWTSAYTPDDRQRAARLLITSPLWPLRAYWTLKEIFDDATLVDRKGE